METDGGWFTHTHIPHNVLPFLIWHQLLPELSPFLTCLPLSGCLCILWILLLCLMNNRFTCVFRQRSWRMLQQRTEQGYHTEKNKFLKLWKSVHEIWNHHFFFLSAGLQYRLLFWQLAQTFQTRLFLIFIYIQSKFPTVSSNG